MQPSPSRSASSTRWLRPTPSTPRWPRSWPRWSANGPAAVKACKRLVQDLAGRPIDADLRADTARRIADIRASAEGKAGVQSFLSKTAPPWQA